MEKLKSTLFLRIPKRKIIGEKKIKKLGGGGGTNFLCPRSKILVLDNMASGISRVFLFYFG